MLELMFFMSTGEIRFYRSDGSQLVQFTYQIDPVFVQKDWYKKTMYASSDTIYNYIADPLKVTENHVAVDPHILATPVIADLNNDDRIEELIIPVSYFFDDEDYRSPEKLKHLQNMTEPTLSYLVAGVTVLNLTNMQVIFKVCLELSELSSEFPAFLLFSPTVIDLDSNGGELEIIIGSSTGNLHILTHSGQLRAGFPKSLHSLQGQVSVADLNNDGKLEIITMDTSDNVSCLDHNGNLQWEQELSGVGAGSRIIDINHDGTLDVVVATSDGKVFALSGKDGSHLPNWPLNIGSKIVSNILITKIGSSDNQADMVFAANDGNLYIVSSDRTCQVHIPIEETSLVEVLSHDLVKQSPGLELLVSTRDGTLICLGVGRELSQDYQIPEAAERFHQQNSCPAVTKTYNDFSFSIHKPFVYIMASTRHQGEVTGSSFWFNFEIVQKPRENSKMTVNYMIKIYYGKNLLFKSHYTEVGQYSVKIPTWPQPGQGHMTIQLTNQHGQVFQDSFALRFNEMILQDLQWLLLAPFVAMVTILLVNHGFPAKDLLPMTFPEKAK
ncbi:protein DEFECTIVE IN EXINE FORMATION 1-like isoform X2 [Gigantopelta aegis]|nr:protein DEFECTIVE IN EXINE FORMATION 1-like isoform X2 [Gigantopelta aegis]